MPGEPETERGRDERDHPRVRDDEPPQLAGAARDQIEELGARGGILGLDPCALDAELARHQRDRAGAGDDRQREPRRRRAAQRDREHQRGDRDDAGGDRGGRTAEPLRGRRERRDEPDERADDQEAGVSPSVCSMTRFAGQPWTFAASAR